MKYGYARIPTDDQKAGLQINVLKKAKCDYIFSDSISGTVKKHQELNRCLESLRPGDGLIVWKLDRLSPSLWHLVAVLSDLQGRGIAFRSLTEAIDTESAAWRLMGISSGALAEFELSLIVERTQAGLNAAKKTRYETGA